MLFQAIFVISLVNKESFELLENKLMSIPGFQP